MEGSTLNLGSISSSRTTCGNRHVQLLPPGGTGTEVEGRGLGVNWVLTLGKR